MKVYAGKNKDDNIRIQSSSGGIFTALAESVLLENGVVFGSAYEEADVKHIKIDNINELHRLRGSKYVYSPCNLQEVKDNLDKKVLFSGTPCQVMGLKSFLGKEYDNLLCVDVICHGTPKVSEYKKYINSFDKKITKINFRDKSDGWSKSNIHITFEDGTEYKEPSVNNKYMIKFLNDDILRECCYKCPAKEFNSGSDITIGDYWGIQWIHPEFHDEKGCSAVIVKTEKGQRALNEITNKIDIIDSTIEKVLQCNTMLTKSSERKKAS